MVLRAEHHTQETSHMVHLGRKTVQTGNSTQLQGGITSNKDRLAPQLYIQQAHITCKTCSSPDIFHNVAAHQVVGPQVLQNVSVRSTLSSLLTESLLDKQVPAWTRCTVAPAEHAM